MVTIIEKSITDGSCNYCDRGELNELQNGLIYPYKVTYHISNGGNGITPRFCLDCLVELLFKCATLKETPNKKP